MDFLPFKILEDIVTIQVNRKACLQNIVNAIAHEQQMEHHM